VSSANRSGAPPATTAADAEAQLGDAVAVYLDGGPCSGDVASTIVDLTGVVPKLLRRGVISVARLREVVTLAVDDEWLEDEAAVAADGMAAAGTAASDGTASDGTAPDDGPADGAESDSTPADGTPGNGAAAG